MKQTALILVGVLAFSSAFASLPDECEYEQLLIPGDTGRSIHRKVFSLGADELVMQFCSDEGGCGREETYHRDLETLHSFGRGAIIDHRDSNPRSLVVDGHSVECM